MGQTFHRLVPRPPPRLLSLVIPTYNEQAMIPLLRPIVTDFLAGLPYPAEAIFVNDGSSDQTLELLLEWASTNPNVKVLGLARNFGHQAAITVGLDIATGDAVVILDADLQDPLDVIPKMVERYQQGYDVVFGQRTARSDETGFKRFTAWLFYRLMQKLIHPDLPADAGDFRLISRSCLDAVASMRETHRFLRGMVAWAGFAQIAVPYERPARAAGQTKYPLRKMLKFAWTAAVSFSTLPLRMSLTFGLLVAILGILWGFFAVLAKITGLYTVPGWTSQMVLISVLGGAILISNGILGEYIGRIFEELKDRPLYIVSSTANTPPYSTYSAKARRGEELMDPAYTLEYELFEKKHWWHVARGELIRWAIDRYAAPTPQTRWLDIGCGTGVLLEQYSRIAPSQKIGLEMDEGSVQRGKEKGLDIRQTADPNDFNYSAVGRFDLITICDVIEHVEQDDRAIAGVYDALLPGGITLITAPALLSLWSAHDVRNRHFRRYVKSGLRRLFPADRWDVMRTTYFSSFLLPMIWSYRTAKKLFKGTDPAEAHNDKKFGPPLIDATLLAIFRAECRCIRLASMPVGSSLLLIARRRN